jgi:hypothetical protein
MAWPRCASLAEIITAKSLTENDRVYTQLTSNSAKKERDSAVKDNNAGQIRHLLDRMQGSAATALVRAHRSREECVKDLEALRSRMVIVHGRMFGNLPANISEYLLPAKQDETSKTSHCSK